MRALIVLPLLFSLSCGWKIFHLGKFRGPKSEVSPSRAFPDLWFDQKLDHFDPTSDKLWKQRYFVNDEFHEKGGPVFLMIGGEGKADAIWMEQGMWVEYAKQFKALCFQVEHRFYGKSHPTENSSVKNLVYLSSEQALADLSYFIRQMNKKYSLPRGTQWVTFGGSYPGSLSAWMRLKYPHLVHAAVSASGPLLAVADFSEYMRVVRDSLATHSDECVSAVAEANKQFEILLRHRIGQQRIDKLFNLCDSVVDSSKNDISNLYETLAGNFAGVVQYNKDNRQFEGAIGANITIDVVCDIMTKSSIGSAVTRYAAVNDLLMKTYDQKCLDYKYENMINEFRNETLEGATGAGRQWMYQTCTEFGFFQTSTLPTQPFADHFPVDFFIQQCSDVYGPRYNKELLSNGILRTNVMYGALQLEVSRVVFVHGSIDPWHALGITKSDNNEAPAIYINGTAHCANMYPESQDDPSQLTAARQRITGLLAQWLQPSARSVRFQPV
ncbi:putative serine protease K12H4.7 [Cloeon dipterum]|uniref:putative serine protease K12H4.7 n=1 Tax=Cloeon dipterum TaxID=197152 RepID=UPI0032209001